FGVGDVIEYGADVENLGPDDVPGATFTWTAFGDVILDGVFGLCSEITSPVVGTVAVTCPLDPLAAGATRGIPVLRVIPQSEGDVEIWGAVSVPPDVIDPNPDNDRQERIVSVGPTIEADLAVTRLLEPTGPFGVGDVIEYGADVENLGPDDVPGATFTWTAFGDVILDGVFGLCSEITNPVVGTVAVTCPLDPIAAGGTRGIPVLRIVPESTNDVTVWATVTAPEGVVDPNSANNRQERILSIDPLVADLFLSLIDDSPDPVPEGEVVRYRVYAQSGGTGDDLPRVLVDMQVDGDAQLVSMPTGLGVSCDDFSSTDPSPVYVRCEIAPLQAGIASPPLDLEVRALSGPSLQAQAEAIHIASISTDPDPSNNTQSETTTVSPPPSGATAYVAVSGTNQVQAVNAATNTIVATMATGEGPWGMAPRPGTDELWVTNRAGERITRISTSSNTVIGTIFRQTGFVGDFFDVGFSTDGATAYVTVNEPASNAPRVSVLDANAGSFVTNIMVPQAFPGEIAVLPDGSKAYVATGEGVTVLDLTTNTVATSIPMTGGTSGVDIAPDGSAVYVTQRDGTNGLLREIDPTTDGLVGVGIPVGIEPNGVVVSPDGLSAYVAEGRARVFVVDLVAGTSSSIFTGVGTAPQSIDVTSDGALLFVTDRDGAQVLEIDLTTLGITPTAVGSFPAEVVIRN
ncbi:MAG TPA: YncE family protein, partial [Longimicrobiales bacterium]|nr:YncE family protein [Longimicrobiales bacterium]